MLRAVISWGFDPNITKSLNKVIINIEIQIQFPANEPGSDFIILQEHKQDGNSSTESDILETTSENIDTSKQRKRKKCPAGVSSRHVYCLHLSTLSEVDHQFCSHYTPGKLSSNIAE